MLSTGGLPFHLARNPNYKNSYNFAAHHAFAGYTPLSYNALRTTLLQREKANIYRLLAPFQAMWIQKGISIISHGWSDSQKRALINFTDVSGGQPMFLKAVDY